MWHADPEGSGRAAARHGTGQNDVFAVDTDRHRGGVGLDGDLTGTEPDAHHSLEPLSNLSLRAGWATSMARPYELLPTSTA